MGLERKAAIKVVRSLTRGADNEIEEIVDRWEAKGLDNSCAWHELWEWVMEKQPFPLCSICDGPVDPRLTAHALCVARHLRNLPTPKLDSTPKCGCHKCRGA